ncbi:hypothetical protein [Croceimicrobium sp.]|uniref:hypothetical protein n=1 Tax=Croceimicrobium sp. TaxID=2828340 RepID=UPI003BAD9DAD
MEERRLSQEELIEIYDLCKRKDIRYLELRLELVDHIASRVEELWQEQPQLSFKEAFHKVYKSFGIFGLSKVAEEHEKVVTRRFWITVWKELKLWFKIPQVLLTLLIFGTLYLLMLNWPVLSQVIYVINYVAIISLVIYIFRERRQMSKTLGGDQSMIMGSLYQSGWLFYLIYFTPFNNWILFNQDGFFNLLLTGKGILINALLSFFSALTMVCSAKLLRMAKSETVSLLERQSHFQRTAQA